MSTVISLPVRAKMPGESSELSTAAEVIEMRPRESRRQLRQQAEPATETGKNYRIRRARREAWWSAERVTQYWRARLDWQGALVSAQRNRIGDSLSVPREALTRIDLVEMWRRAVAQQLLTPAPDLAAISWKRTKLAGRGFDYLPCSRERVNTAVAADVEFLATHPIRKSKQQP